MVPSKQSADVLVFIRTTLRPGCDLTAYEVMDARMNEILSKIPGYLGVKGYTADDGESIAIVRFESREALIQWRDHPEHLEAQRAGREKFYATYEIRVCAVERAYDFSAEREPLRISRG
ncbi:MAG TPA: antibiotic biosynthesis monooxygenase [Polyangiaceae bacterium]|nr:antibiotic biosynthesis monooxygenase [Polyangiaceae bacterium]